MKKLFRQNCVDFFEYLIYLIFEYLIFQNIVAVYDVITRGCFHCSIYYKLPVTYSTNKFHFKLWKSAWSIFLLKSFTTANNICSDKLNKLQNANYFNGITDVKMKQFWDIIQSDACWSRCHNNTKRECFVIPFFIFSIPIVFVLT